ncbi:MAG: porin family protein [Deltaproteobacteria bacterium]|nr:porin family protein [Deltaproteobacteria bacterium]
MRQRGLIRQAAPCIWMCIIAFAGSTQATEPDYAETGPYLGAGAAFAWENFEIRGRSDPDMAFGVNGWGGYRLHRFLAVELQVEYLNGFDTRREFQSFLPGFGNNVAKSDMEAVIFTGNLKAYLPLGRFQPFVLAGMGLGYFKLDSTVSISAFPTFRSSDSDTDLAVRLGGGFDFYLLETLALQLSSSYVLPTGDFDGFDYVSLIAGLQYRF